jgi:hypothetical protein
MKGALDYGFLAGIRGARITLQFEADGFAEFPAFAGSAIRGALGRLLRPPLCEQRPPCAVECREPGRCRYYSLFEQRQAGGRNIPKPLLLAPPVPPELEQIAFGGAVRFPYRESPPLPGERVPRLGTDLTWRAPSGAPVVFGLTLVGAAAALAPALMEQVARCGLTPPRGRLRLRRAVDRSAPERVLFDARLPQLGVQAPQVGPLAANGEAGGEVRRLRVVFLTPALLNVNGATCMDPEEIARRFPSQCLVRAMQIYDAFCSAGGGRLPWMDLPEMNARLAGSRLFRYVLPRVSFRQDRRMHFDGLLGYFDLEGDLTPAMPFVQAAEALHFGQKATFGLGLVRCLRG